jgi:hypothetical protein
MNIKQTSFPAGTALAIASLAAAMTSCSSNSAPAAQSLTALAGTTAPVSAGSISSYVTTDAAGKPVEMGLTLNDAALTGLGDDMSMVVLSLPHVANLAFQNAVINWNPHGHPPAHIYDVPQHFVLASAPEFHGQPFTATPIYGFWNGHLAFVEGMVTTAYLTSRQSMTQFLRQPAAVDKPGYYPTSWQIAHNAAIHTTTVAFDGFVKH